MYSCSFIQKCMGTQLAAASPKHWGLNQPLVVSTELVLTFASPPLRLKDSQSLRSWAIPIILFLVLL